MADDGIDYDKIADLLEDERHHNRAESDEDISDNESSLQPKMKSGSNGDLGCL